MHFDAGVLDGAVDRELAHAVPQAPLGDVSIPRELPDLRQQRSLT